MTIKEKIMKAWADSWRVVSVTEKNAEPVRCKIITFNPGDNSFCLLAEDAARKIYRIGDLIDIGFPLDDEACDTRNVFVEFKDSFREDPKQDKKWPSDEESPIMTALQDAFESRKKVTVRYTGTTEEHECTGYVKEISCVKTEAGKGSLISFGDQSSISATMYLSAIKEVAPNDIAKQRWEHEDDIDEDEVIIHDRTILFSRMGASDAQMALAAAAPKLLDVLSELRDVINKTGHGRDSIMTMFLKRDYVQRVHDAIARARGDDQKEVKI